MYRIFLSKSLFLLLILLSQNTMADPVEIELNNLESKLSLSACHLDDVARWHGEYKLLRDHYYHGPSGVVFLAQQWLDGAVTWIESLHGIIELLRCAEEQLDSKPVQHELVDKINKAREDWLSLKNVARKVVEQGDLLKKRLLDLGEIPEDIIENYSEITQLLNKRHQELIAAVTWSVDAFDKKEQNYWEEILNPMTTATRALIKRSLTHHSDGFKRIERERQFLLSLTAYDPLFLELNSLETKMLKLISDSQIFAAGKVFDEITEVYQKNLSIIEDSLFDASLKGPAVKKIKLLYENYRSFYEKNRTHSRLFTFVNNNLRANGRQLLKDCLDDQKRYFMNCNLLYQIVEINPFELSLMSEAELEVIENSIERVRKGPLS